MKTTPFAGVSEYEGANQYSIMNAQAYGIVRLADAFGAVKLSDPHGNLVCTPVLKDFQAGRF